MLFNLFYTYFIYFLIIFFIIIKLVNRFTNQEYINELKKDLLTDEKAFGNKKFFFSFFFYKNYILNDFFFFNIYLETTELEENKPTRILIL